MLQFMIISKPLFLNIFWKVFLIFSDCGPLVFLKTANPSSLYSPILLGLYLLPIKLNKKIPISSHTSARSYDPIVASKLLLCFLIHGFPSLCKTDFLAWKIVSLSFAFIATCYLADYKASISKPSLINKNTLELSYSCMSNIKTKINAHNRDILRNTLSKMPNSVIANKKKTAQWTVLASKKV